MNGIIVAAGRSSRLYPRTLDTPKCMLEINGESLIHRSIRLMKTHGVTKIYVTLGFYAEKLRDHLPEDVHCVYNPFYATTNNMVSLWLAIPHVRNDDILYQHSDLIYQPELLPEFLNNIDSHSLELAVEYGSVHEEAMKVEAKENTYLQSNKKMDRQLATGEWIGLARIPEVKQSPLYEVINQCLMDEQYQAYDTKAFNRLATHSPGSIQIRDIDGREWMEIDNEEDWQGALQTFGDPR